MGETFGKLYLFTFIIAAVAALLLLGYKYKLAILLPEFYLHRAYGQNHLSESLFHHHHN
jgi:hypothetical protein